MEGRSDLARVGGMVEAVYAEPHTADRIENLRLDPEGFWTVMPGTVQVTDLLANDGPITSLVWFNPRPGQRWLVLERSVDDDTANIEYVDLNDQSTVLIAARNRVPANDRGTVFAEFARWLFMFSAIDAPLRWNGLWTSPVGFTGPPSPPRVAGPNEGFLSTGGFAIFDAAAGTYGLSFKSQKQRGVGPYPATTDQNWRYGYAITTLNELGQESPLSPLVFASGVNESDQGRTLVRVSIPRQPDHVRGVRVWRTQNIFDVDSPVTEATVRFLVEFNTGGLIDYLDMSSDSELGLPFDRDSVGPIPIGARAACFWQGSLWLGGAPVDSTRLHYSSPLFPEQFPSINYIPVGSSRTGAIVALHPSPRGLVVFKEGGLYIVRGSPSEGYHADTITEEIGCAAPRAIENIRGFGVVFLATSGPHRLILGGNDEQPAVVPIEGIRRTWRRYAGQRLTQAVSVYDPEFEEVWFQIPQGGNRYPTLGLVFHAQIQQWSLRVNWPVLCFARQFGRTFFGSWDDDTVNKVGVHVITSARLGIVGNGNSINGRYTAARVSEKKELVTTVEPWVLALGDEPMTLTVQVDRQTAAAQTESGKAQRPNQRDHEVWGTAVWDATKAWDDWVPARLQIATRMVLGGDVLFTLSADRMRLFGINLIVAKNETVSPRPEGRP